ncbi:hypothetical protein [Mycobacterium sherrisii]|uniref:hypothetical protein n=1 Tax=Mycobacterium sherrisii TaxID=243061 RepID=UPI001301D4E5|nr:hypothetical protein [Mycobacterium sherrisii]MCV7029517.1 hypothetical protein [Mycobacterium sherrisii]MEC4761660.1 hypothetical protein [Mycobacterium sherrisii]
MSQSDSLGADEAAAHAAVWEIITGHWRSQILRSLARPSVADHLAVITTTLPLPQRL